MTESELRLRTKKFALSIISLVNSLPKNRVGFTHGNQLIRSGTSVGANYRAVCRARSSADFISKLGIVIEEADESCFWLEIIIDGKILSLGSVSPILKEANEITAIMVVSRNTIISRSQKNLKLQSLVVRKI